MTQGHISLFSALSSQVHAGPECYSVLFSFAENPVCGPLDVSVEGIVWFSEVFGKVNYLCFCLLQHINLASQDWRKNCETGPDQFIKYWIGMKKLECSHIKYKLFSYFKICYNVCAKIFKSFRCLDIQKECRIMHIWND